MQTIKTPVRLSRNTSPDYNCGITEADDVLWFANITPGLADGCRLASLSFTAVGRATEIAIALNTHDALLAVLASAEEVLAAQRDSDGWRGTWLETALDELRQATKRARETLTSKVEEVK